MNLMARQDRVLLGGLALALIVVFARPIRYLLEMAREVERTSGLALMPALIILTVVFLFHQQGKRQEAKTRAAAAEAEARLADARATELEWLVTFGQALGRALDLDTIRDVVAQFLPKLTGSNEAWIMLRMAQSWQALVGTARESRGEIERTRESVVNRALMTDTAWASGEITAPGHLVVPMSAGGNPVGVLGIPDAAGPFSASRKRVLAMAAALLAISIRNAQLFQDLRANSLRDTLTGCFNRAYALEVLDTELRRARRSHTPMSVIMFDIDHFKDINDRYGHLCGDAVLAAVGARMRDVLRGSDVKCRYGGEEFLVLLPETPLEGAKRVAETLRRGLAEMPINWQAETVVVTASFGVSGAMSAEVDGTALIARADAALYRAKDQGRNCVSVSADAAVAASAALPRS
jgi:diguanylate cyclase (GGDEF)-like protein